MARIASVINPTAPTAHVMGTPSTPEASWLEAARSAPDLRATTARVRRLYDRTRARMTQTQTVWGDALNIFDAPHVAELPLVVRRAVAVRRVLAEMPIAIEEDDLIVGNSAQDGVIVRTRLPRYGTEQEYRQAQQLGSTLSAQLSHKTPYYYTVLAQGLNSIIAEIDVKLAAIEARPPDAAHAEKLAFFRAMKLEAAAVIELAHRYADLALVLADKTSSAQRREELRAIAQVCRRVPEYPARTFHEAIQAFWLLHYALYSTGTHISCGRFDQYLTPALHADLASGALTLAQAQEYVDCVWIRFNDRGQIVRENFYHAENGANAGRTPKTGMVIDKGPQSWTAGHRKRFQYATDAADAINHFGQNLLLSGIKPDGGDGTGPLTYLCLNALEKFAFTSPVVTLRLHRASPPELVARAAEVLKAGSGMPYINNDDVLIPAYTDLGVTLVDARDYANSNCWETMIEGKSDQELIRGINFLLFLELALHRGVSGVHGRMGPDTGDPRHFATFDDLMHAWRVQTDHQLQAAIDYIGAGIADGTLEHSNHGRYSYNPLLSALTLDCIENEQDVIRGGSRYTIWHVMGEAAANAIDALAAIKKLVYVENSLRMDDLLAALDGNWQDDAPLRQRLIARAPKFANDDDFADDLGRAMLDYFIARTRFHARRYPQVIFPCSVGTFSWYAMIGKEVCATPDGRFQGEAIAANFSPVPGRDMHGPTAAINSYLKMPVQHMAAGAPLDLRLSSNSLAGEAGTQRLAGLIETFIELGGNMLTFTVTDVEELKRAMEEPEKCRHLRVRMGGWSAYFVMLSREQQLLHIARVEHGLV